MTLLAADMLVRTSTGEAVTFWLLGALALAGAVGVVTAATAVYSAMFLAMTMLILAAFYLVQDAMFLGVVQVVVYTGAVMMLFLFVIMLIGVDSAESLVETLRGQRIAAVTAGTGFGVLLIAGIGSATMRFTGLAAANAGGNVEGLAALIFTRYLWAFELTGALLITAVIAAMVLAHRERIVPRPTQRELSIRRFQHGHHPTPLPTPGVYARHNAVDIAARLPDGSYSALSVSDTLTHRWVGASGNAARADDAERSDEEEAAPSTPAADDAERSDEEEAAPSTPAADDAERSDEEEAAPSTPAADGSGKDGVDEPG